MCHCWYCSCTVSLKAVLLILGAHLALLDLIAKIVSNHHPHRQNQAASSLLCSVILRNIYASMCNEMSPYSISLGCGCGVHCIRCIADQLYCGSDSCKLQVSVKDTFLGSVYTDSTHSFLSVRPFTIVGIQRKAPHPR